VRRAGTSFLGIASSSWTVFRFLLALLVVAALLYFFFYRR